MKKRMAIIKIYLFFICLIFCYLFYLAQTEVSDIVKLTEQGDLIIQEPVVVNNLVTVSVTDVKIVTDTSILGDTIPVVAKDNEEFVYIVYSITSNLEEPIKVCPTTVLYYQQEKNGQISYYPDQSKLTTTQLKKENTVLDVYDYEKRTNYYRKPSAFTVLYPNVPTYFHTVFQKLKSDDFAYGISILNESFQIPAYIENILSNDYYDVLEVGNHD